MVVLSVSILLSLRVSTIHSYSLHNSFLSILAPSLLHFIGPPAVLCFSSGEYPKLLIQDFIHAIPVLHTLGVEVYIAIFYLDRMQIMQVIC